MARTPPKRDSEDKLVLVGVLKSKNDRRILLRHRWYRIPVEFLPKRRFEYIAFYQPIIFGKHGKRVEYYGKVLRKKVYKRIQLLPKEPDHPRAKDDYLKVEFAELKRLPRPVRNIIPRRVFFGFTSLGNLLSARDILELYGVPATEQIVGRRLKRYGIRATPEFSVRIEGKRFRLDFAIIRGGKCIAVECDNYKAHANKLQKRKDKMKDAYLRRAGWRVIRLKERDIIENLDSCIKRVQKVIS